MAGQLSFQLLSGRQVPNLSFKPSRKGGLTRLAVAVGLVRTLVPTILYRPMRAFLSKVFTIKSIPRDVFLTFVGALLGVGTSHLYYVKAVSDMRADAEERKRIDALIFQGIESNGSITYVRDGDGRVIGVQIHLRGAGQAQASGAATITVTPPGKHQ